MMGTNPTKHEQLLAMYAQMATQGYQTRDHQTISSAFNDMEIRKFRDNVKTLLQQFGVRSLLDYGCGGSNYEAPGFAGELSAQTFFGLDQVRRFEPARNIDERAPSDAVLCFDVLEHVFISEVPRTLRELFGLTQKLLILNIACYPARALLPNGENAHITVRPSAWWKGMVDAVAIEFPHIAVQLYCSKTYTQVEGWALRRASDWEAAPTFVSQP
jgi:hypothetical protein